VHQALLWLLLLLRLRLPLVMVVPTMVLIFVSLFGRLAHPPLQSLSRVAAEDI